MVMIKSTILKVALFSNEASFLSFNQIQIYLRLFELQLLALTIQSYYQHDNNNEKDTT